MELGRMHASPAPTQPYRMLQLKHVVIQNVLRRISRNREIIENSADDNCIVRRIIMSQNAARLRWTPAHARPAHQPVKESRVQILENNVEVVNVTLRRMQPLASAHLPH